MMSKAATIKAGARAGLVQGFTKTYIIIEQELDVTVTSQQYTEYTAQDAQGRILTVSYRDINFK